MKYVTRVLVGLLASLVAAPALAGEPDEPTGQVETVTPGGELIINMNKWARPGSGKNTGLIVWYTWEGKAKRRATVIDGNSLWMVRFADRPEVGKQGTIEYAFTFELSAEERAKLNAGATKIDGQNAKYFVAVAELWTKLNASEKALEGAPSDKKKQAARDAAKAAFDEQHEKAFGTLKAAIADLGAFTDEKGTPAEEIILKALGFEKDAKSSTGWKPKSSVWAAQTKSFETHAGANRDGRDEAVGKIKNSDGADNKCILAAEANAADLKADVEGIEACVAEIKKARSAVTAAADAVADAAKAHKANPNADTLRALESALNDGLAFALFGVSDIHHDGLKALVNHVALGFWAHQEAARLSKLTEKIKQTRITLKSSAQATDILKQEGERRNFDVASGVVYVTELDEWVVPLMVAWCPWGCHRPDAGFEGVENWVSIDLGMRVSMIDSGNQIDPRHDTDTVSPMIGVSLNPSSFFRFSVGRYVFNNAQTHDWNGSLYAGVTMDMVRLAEVSKLVGLGEPPKPKIQAK